MRQVDLATRETSNCEHSNAVLKRAQLLVNGDRLADYGDALTNHQRIADFWTVRLREKLLPGETIEAHDVSALMRLAKEARLMQTPGHEDSLVDIAGYSQVEARIHLIRQARDEREGR